MTTQASFIANIQDKLPYAKLILQKKPGPHFDWHSCALTAVSLEDHSKSFSMTFEDDLDEAPMNDVIKSFVDNASHVLNRVR